LLVYNKITMILFGIFTGILKTFTPYLRKNLLLTLDPHDYLFLNTFIILILTTAFLLFKIIFQNHDMDLMIKKYQSLSLLQICFALLIGLVTISSSILILNLDKYYNTPLINSLILKIGSAMMLLFVGIFIYEEKYNYKQMLGMVLAIIGVFLLFCKDK